MNVKCVNAEDVLPVTLLKEVQKHVSGKVWIPEASINYEKRDELILGLHKRGKTNAELAETAKISIRRVQQIIAAGQSHRSEDGERDQKDRHLLPEVLMKKVRKYATGLLWVPQADSPSEQRKRLVLGHHLKGKSNAEIAQEVKIGVRRVQQILADAKKSAG